jgi:hypothetical protein
VLWELGIAIVAEYMEFTVRMRPYQIPVRQILIIMPVLVMANALLAIVESCSVLVVRSRLSMLSLDPASSDVKI